MKKINIILLIIGMILCSSMPCKAENELGYAVSHLCQKMLAEPETAQDIEYFLHYPVSYKAKPSGFDELKPEELNVLVEQYKNDQFLQDYYDYVNYIAYANKIDYVKLEKLVKESDNITKTNRMWSVIYGYPRMYYETFQEAVFGNLVSKCELKPLALEAPKEYIDKYKDILDSLIEKYSGINGHTDGILKNCYGKSTLSDKKANEYLHRCYSYIEQNKRTMFLNMIYRFFPDEESMNAIKHGMDIKGYGNFCASTDIDVIKYSIGKSFFEWCEKDNRIQNAKKLAAENGIKSTETYSRWKDRNRIHYGNMGRFFYPSTDYDEEPSFAGGNKALSSYISKHLRYPYVAQQNEIGGKFYISFDVEVDGSIANPKIIARDSKADLKLYFLCATSDNALESPKAMKIKKSLDALEAHALKLYTNMPKWIPAKKDGRAVKSQFCMSGNYISNPKAVEAWKEIHDSAYKYNNPQK